MFIIYYRFDDFHLLEVKSVLCHVFLRKWLFVMQVMCMYKFKSLCYYHL